VHDAQVVFARDLQLAEAESARAREELEAGHYIPVRTAYSVRIEQTLSWLSCLWR
jgi:hypothetical protein